MCGIAGILNLDGRPVSPVALRRMTDALVHRGPDGEGFYTDKCVGLGHRRLAIIDLSSAGHQPMISLDQEVVLSYNGEIYNFQELRTELESLGHSFRSMTDSEVVLNAWLEWGEDCVGRFNGMFAFAVWDRREQALYLVRDRYGIKPLYYAKVNNTVLFGSEQKAVIAHHDFQRRLNKSALFEYFSFQNIFTNQTLLESVSILEPATVLRIPLKGEHTFRKRSYWDYAFSEPEGKVDVREYREELDRLLQQAASRQLVTDVEVGSYLSGGMDSGTLTALAARELPYIKTFTCGFDLSSASGLELAFDERVKAEAMSATFRTEHYEMVLKAGDMERCLSDLAWHLEEPRVGQSYPNYYVSRLASKFVKVVLSGAGGDELFGGYPWRYHRVSDSRTFDEYVSRYYAYWQRLVDEQGLKQMFSPCWSEVESVGTRDIFNAVFQHRETKIESPEEAINNSLYFEAKTFLHGLFVVEDKLSMAHSLETRVPFMDNDLVDFAMRCPVGLKLNDLGARARIDENESKLKREQRFTRTNDGKQILRDVMGKYIPAEISEGIKQGFSAPDASWFKGDSIEFVKRSLLDPKAEIYDVLDYKIVESMIQSHLNGESNRRLFVWSMLNFQAWMERFL